MWTHRLTRLGERKVQHYALLDDGGKIDRATALDKMENDSGFRSYLRQILANIPFEAFRWETPPLRHDNLRRPFEFVAIEAIELLRPQDPSDFSEHFGGVSAPDMAVSFPSLGGDCVLVTPRPTSQDRDFSSLATFSRTATDAQNDGLWKLVAQEVNALLPQRPVWLSTAGDGVPWLHIRLDTKPKYYRFPPYLLSVAED